MAIPVNDWEKFKLLLWKNWLLQWNHKTQFLVELMVPVLFSMLLVLIRSLLDVELKPITTFPEVNISTIRSFNESMVSRNAFDLPLFILPYSPKNQFLDNIVDDAVKSLKLRGYLSFDNAESLEQELKSKNYLAGIQFDDKLAGITSYPEKISFTLRYPGVLRTDARKKTLGLTWTTNHLYPRIKLPGPRNPHFPAGGSPVGYIPETFIPIQQALSMSYLKLAGKTETLPEIVMQRYPYPEYIDDPLLTAMENVFPFILLLSFIYPCTSIVKCITAEKEKQLKEVMKIMGIQNWIHWTAWFIKQFLMLSISCILIVMLIKLKWTHGVSVLTYSSSTALFFFLMIYIICSICFCFMCAVFFSKSSTAAAVMGLLWFIAYVPNMFLNETYNDLSLAQKLFYCLFINTAMAFGIKTILKSEGTGEGLQWSNIFKPVNADDSLTLGTVMIMMLIAGALYLLICLYIEQILPGEFGVPKKWYFPFTKKFWCDENDYVGVEDFPNSVSERRNPQAFEEEPKNKRVGVQVINLKKKYGEKWAVKGVSLNMYEDEITVLLGHNGAGKTTTISMLTGIFPPTAGTAIINGSDIRSNIDGARMSMGICPQHNVLFDDMSVANHIVFFSRLKGLRDHEVKEEVKKYLKIIELENKENTLSKNLSGGMKRKLSVCCALCGGTKVVLCDEPSSGMDPAARRQLWDLLQAEKVGRTVLLTTHFMDEADTLGDRIAIMCDGELKCHGTSFFLKKKFGSGYKLICVKHENCDIAAVTNLLQKYIPDIQPTSDIGAELTYNLPDSMSPVFKEMFADLESASETIGLNGYGVSITSLEEVFMKVGAENASRDSMEYFSARSIPSGETLSPYDDEVESAHSNSVFSENSKRTKGMELLLNQWEAMFLKKMLYTWRNKLLFLIQNIMPIFFIVITILVSRQSVFTELPPLTMSLTKYPIATALLEVTSNVEDISFESKVWKEYTALVNSYGKKYEVESTHGESFEDYILQKGTKFQTVIDLRYLVAATISKGKFIAWLNNEPLHTAPLTLNLLHNAMARVLIGPNAEIKVTNYPLKYSPSELIQQLKTGMNLGVQMATNIVFCMSFVSSFYILFLIKENVTRSKLLQFVGGVRVWTFWLSQFLWDLLTFAFTVIIVIITLACFQQNGYSTSEDLFRYFGFVIIFGISALPLTYLIASMFTEPATGFAKISIANIFGGMALYLVIIAMRMPGLNTKKAADILVWYFRLYPHFSLAMGLNNMYTNSRTREVCNDENIAVLPDALRCQLLPLCCNTIDFFDWKSPGVLPEVVFLLLSGLSFFLIIILKEYKVSEWLRALLFKKQPKVEDNNLDADVLAEKKRVSDMTRDEINGHYLVLDHVTKYYKNFLAVKGLSLCVKQTECFGLLGVNGAGKTTTFKMLTGDVQISSGSAYVKGMSLKTDMNSIYQEIGYCPQFDALLEDLTGRQTLRIFCLLRGVPKQRIRFISEELAKSFGFMKHMDKPTKAYSGGNKRKLSTAIAVVGSPSVIYLDEPTTGMDPAARRQLWNMVCHIRDSGKSIVLTSHSMEECEALCTRLAIMVNGEFKCIGSTQHLKNKFSKGLILKIKVRPTSDSGSRSSSESSTVHHTTDSRYSGSRLSSLESTTVHPQRTKRSSLLLSSQRGIRRLKEAIEKQYPQAVLQEDYQGMLTYYVPFVDIKWSEIFGFIELNRTELNIEDYLISQTTLEEIFLDFAKYQRDDTRDQTQKKRCCALCC